MITEELECSVQRPLVRDCQGNNASESLKFMIVDINKKAAFFCKIAMPSDFMESAPTRSSCRHGRDHQPRTRPHQALLRTVFTRPNFVLLWMI